MSAACNIASDTGAVRAMIAAVDCNTRDFAHHGYVALTGGEAFQSGLTLVLTIYVALVGYRLLFAADGARLTDAPRMALKIGAVLALVSGWNLFETLAFDLAAKAPAEIAAVISPSFGKPGQQDPVGQLQVAYDQLAADASALALSSFGGERLGVAVGAVCSTAFWPSAWAWALKAEASAASWS